MRKALVFMVILLSVTCSRAQTDPEYRMEIGVGAGLGNYLGDFNGSIIKDMQPMATLLARYVVNPYMGFKMEASYLKMKGSSTDVTTYYPDFAAKKYEFNNTLADFSITYEYNFWPYGTGKDYRGAKRITPFLFGGLGGTFVTGGDKNVFTANIPLGIGVKYKLGERVNLGFQWAVHFSLSDELDGVKDPYGIASKGVFKNTDCYSTLQVTLTYSFMAKCRTCHNEDE